MDAALRLGAYFVATAGLLLLVGIGVFGDIDGRSFFGTLVFAALRTTVSTGRMFRTKSPQAERALNENAQPVYVGVTAAILDAVCLAAFGGSVSLMHGWAKASVGNSGLVDTIALGTLGIVALTFTAAPAVRRWFARRGSAFDGTGDCSGG